MTLEDSGERIDYGTGAVRDISSGKGRYDLIPPYPLKRLAIHYENGAEKYEERNWEKGIPTSRCFSSAIRHLYRWLDGERGEDHLSAAVWNIFTIIHHEVYKPEMVDTPQPQKEERWASIYTPPKEMINDESSNNSTHSLFGLGEK